jgi:putative endonuclease
MAKPNKSNSPHLFVGKLYEYRAHQWLKRQGLQPLYRNYHTKGGEIDIIMQDDDILVFVEVRYRNNRSWQNAAESINFRKQQRIIYAARHFIQRHQQHQAQQCRFDAICFTQINQVDWIKDAFRVQ